MLWFGLIAAISAVFFISSNAECANGCSGHGRCTSYDMCVCNRNWMANDCSERVCQFGLAHVDTPKGDLDMSGSISSANKVVAQNSAVYPYGTTEQFPNTKDSDLQEIPNSAHYYMECSNKGVCDRATGTCQCYDGYDGASCQRASCPGFPESCSGHGVCRSIEQLANDDYGNIYKLWDRRSTMGCSCDKGYFGPDCSLRTCKQGVDPLYLDDTATIRYSTYDVAVLTTAGTIDFNDGTPLKGAAYFAIRFFDIHGEDWLTQPIPSGASCETVQDALYALPNNVIPDGTVWCTLTSNSGVDGANGWVNGEDTHYSTGSDEDTLAATNQGYYPFKTGSRLIKYPLAFWEQAVRKSYGDQGQYPYYISGYIYRLKFLGNAGKLRQPEVEVYLDGKRPSIVSSGKVITAVWTDGQAGESKDFFADHCDGVTVKFGYAYNSGNPQFYLTGFTAASKALLKTCLADADFDTTNNVEVYNWDYGSKAFPHIVKFVKSRTTYTDGGYYVAIYYDTSETLDNLATGGTFKMLNPFFSPDDYSFALRFQTSNFDAPNVGYTLDYKGYDSFEVYTTKSTLALTSNHSQAIFGFGSREIFMTNMSADVHSPKFKYDGDISCEVGANNAFKSDYVPYCLNKTDYFTFLNFEKPVVNPAHMNLYQAMKLSVKKFARNVGEDPFNSMLPAYGGFPFASGPNSGVTYSKARTGAGSYVSHFLINSIVTDISTNWATTTYQNPIFHVYKFFPASASTYEYVAQCSNRGLCDYTTGLCNCFPGYSHDDCSEQNSLHV